MSRDERSALVLELQEIMVDGIAKNDRRQFGDAAHLLRSVMAIVPTDEPKPLPEICSAGVRECRQHMIDGSHTHALIDQPFFDF